MGRRVWRWKGSGSSGVRVRDDFRFFTTLRSVQNDREGALEGMRGLRSEWQYRPTLLLSFRVK